MLDRMIAGVVPDKPHTALRDDAGQLRHEECLTREGFDGPFTILYHLERPHLATPTTPGTAGRSRPPPTASRARSPPALPLAGAGPARGSRRSTRACRCCSTTTSSSPSSTPTSPTRSTSRTATATISTSSSRAAACCARRSAISPSRRTTTSSSPRGSPTASSPTTGSRTGSRSSAPPGFGLLPQWRNAVGQLRMDAPYSHRDFRRPTFTGPCDEGLRDLLVKRGGAFHGFRLPHLAARRRRLGRHGLPLGVPDPQLPAARRPGPPAADRARHVRRARRAHLQLRPAPARLPPRRDPLPLPAFVGRLRRDHLLRWRGLHLAQGGRRREPLAPPGRHHPRPAPGRLRGEHRRARHRRAGRHARHHRPLHATAAARSVEDPGYHASFG